MYKLLIEDDEGGKTAVSLIRDEITIGRKEGNTIRLTERNVSRRHGRIVRDDDRIFIEDVAARYGIKKNGKKIDERAELKEGDVVLIGDYRLTLQADTKGEKKKAKKSGPAARAPGKADKNEQTQITSLENLKAGSDFADDRRENTQIMQTMPAKLVVISSNFAGEEFPLHSEEMIIGRGDDCHIIIDHRSISNKHAKIVRKDRTTYNIVDLNSRNGVKVSGETYPATHLKRGDVIELGHVKFRFVEPGENYVFTPQAQIPQAAPLAKSSGGGLDPKLIGAALVVMLAVGAVIAFLMMSDSGETEEVVVDTDNTEMVQAAKDLENLEVDEGEDRIAAGIASARRQIQDGRLQRAMGTLELLLEFDPPAGQKSEIDELLSTARNEVPFKNSYESALESLDDGDYMSALQEVSSIPSHSFFYKQMEDDGVFQEIFSGALDGARDALEEGETDVARNMADEVLMARGDYTPASDFLDELEERERQEQEALAQRRAEAQQQQGSGSPTQRTNSGSRPAAPSLSPEEAQELFTGAARKFAGGDLNGAIQDCNRALSAGHTDCHRILGLAHARLEQTTQACNHFRQYMATGPSNPGAAQRQMDNLGCD